MKRDFEGSLLACSEIEILGHLLELELMSCHIFVHLLTQDITSGPPNLPGKRDLTWIQNKARTKLWIGTLTQLRSLPSK